MATDRHIIREHIFKMLFDLNFYSEDEADEQIDLYFEQVEDEDDIPNPPSELSEKERRYAEEKVQAITLMIPQIDQAIEEVSVGWKVRRMPKADLSILRLAVYEIRYDDKIPTGVAINEAVELAKTYGTDATPGFVNGILSKFA